MAPALQICSSTNMFMHDLMQLLASSLQPRGLPFLDRQAAVFWIDPAVSGSQARMQDTAVRGPQSVTPPALIKGARNSRG